MDLSKLSTEDLQALRSGDLSKVSTAGLQSLQGVPSTPALKDYDPVPAGGAPEGFHAVTEDDGNKTLRHNFGLADIAQAINNLPGMGLAEHAAAGVANLGGKAISGLAGVVSGGDPEAVRKVQQSLHVEAPPTTDPLQQGVEALTRGAQAVSAPIDRAVGNLPPGPRTAIEATEEAIPDVASVLGTRGLQGEPTAAQSIARTPQEVAQAAGYTGLRTKADLAAPGAKAITNKLISDDASIVPGQTPSVAALENGRRVGPGRVYTQAENAIPRQLSFDHPGGAELQDALQNLPNTVSDLPRSPDVAALQETMLANPEFSRDTLFANIRESRERAKAAWRADDPDKNALGDAYANLANAYEDFAGRQLEANPNAGVTLADWRTARVQMAKNYQAQGALRGEDFDPQVYARTAERNPHLLTGNAAIVGHVANGLPAGTAASGVLPTALGAAAGEVAGHAAGAPVVGGVVGAVAGPVLRAKLHDLLTRGNQTAAAGAAGNPALSYFFPQGQMPAGWNRSAVAPRIAGLLPSPAMVNAGGGATTQSTLESLGLTPDVQAAGALHPATARLQALREHLAQPPERPAEPVDFQAPPKWGDFSIAPPPPAPQPTAGIPFENVLEQGGTQARPVAGPQRGYRPAPQSPKGPNMRTPPGAPELTDAVPSGPSSAQLAFRNQLAAARLRKVAGDLSMEGPGGSTGDPIARALAALTRQQRGYADGGGVVRGSSSPGSPGVSGAVKDALAALKDYVIDRPKRELQAQREQFENSVIDGTAPGMQSSEVRTDYAHGGAVGYATGGTVREVVVPVREIQHWPRDKTGAYIQPDKNSPKLELIMNHNRMRAANQFDLADTHGFGNAHTYDPRGNYECFTCNQYVKATNDCMVIEDITPTDIQAGSSCRHYEEICAGDPEVVLKRTTKAAALFGTAVNRKGFGCKRCDWRRKSKWQDSLGRDVWCGAMYFTTEPAVCCAINSAKTLPDGTPIKAH